MITDLFLKLAASLIGWMLGFLPSFDGSGLVSGFADAWSQVRPEVALADWYSNVRLGLAMLAFLLVLRSALVAWFAVNWLYKRIPFLGH